MTVLRATAWPAWADEPYGPIVRAIGPTLRALPLDGARGAARAGGPGGRPADARSRPGPRCRPPHQLERRRDGPGAPSGPDARGHPRPARAARGAATGRARTRGPPSRRCRDPCARHLPVEDLARPAPRHRRDAPARRRRSRRPVDGRPRGDQDGSAAGRARRPRAARARRAGRAHRGDRGRTRLGEPVAARRRAVGRPAARDRGAPHRTARAALGVAERLVRRVDHRAAGDPLARVPAGAAPHVTGRAPADRASSSQA